MEQERVLREQEVRALTGLSRTTRWAWERRGKFPRRVNLGSSRLSGWLSSEIQEWIEARRAARDSSSVA